MRWVVDAAHPAGYAVPLTAAEEAQFDVDQTASAAATAAYAIRSSNESAMTQALRDRRQDALDLANALDANTATPAQQRAALALCLRGLVRLGRLLLEDLDQAT